MVLIHTKGLRTRQASGPGGCSPARAPHRPRPRVKNGDVRISESKARRAAGRASSRCPLRIRDAAPRVLRPASRWPQRPRNLRAAAFICLGSSARNAVAWKKGRPRIAARWAVSAEQGKRDVLRVREARRAAPAQPVTSRSSLHRGGAAAPRAGAREGAGQGAEVSRPRARLRSAPGVPAPPLGPTVLLVGLFPCLWPAICPRVRPRTRAQVCCSPPSPARASQIGFLQTRGSQPWPLTGAPSRDFNSWYPGLAS